jgi:putative ABC transport system substrate-binding protein
MPNSYPTGELETAARALKIGIIAAPVSDEAGIEATCAALAGQRRGGLIIMPQPFPAIHRKEIFAAANRHGVPAIYPFSYYAQEGGLISYGVDELDLNWRAASYVDRILKGEKTANLPVQAPTKFEMTINPKTAKELGIAVPPALLASADELIE